MFCAGIMVRLFAIVAVLAITFLFAFDAVTIITPTAFSEPNGWAFVGANQQNTFNAQQTIIQTSSFPLTSLWNRTLPRIAGTPVISNGIMYVTSLNKRIYAIRESNGGRLWVTSPKTLPISARAGVAVDSGMVFAGTTTNDVVALNATTGVLIWSQSEVANIVGSPASYTGSQAAPLVYGGEVIIGDQVGDNGARGFLSAFNETNGNLIWTWYSVPPSPITTSTNQAAWGNTWGTNGTSGCICGGGSIWNMPAVDPTTGIIYFGTGNPWPNKDQIARTPNPSDINLYADCVVALNSKTGQLVWHYQEVPGDQHDYDQGMPVMLFSTTINGVLTQVVGAGGKNGYYYELNAATGALLYKTSIGVHSPVGTPWKVAFPNAFGGVDSFSSFDPTTNLIYTMAYNVVKNISPVNSTLYAIDASTGVIVWSKTMNGLGQGASSTNGIVFTSDGISYFGGTQTFYTLNGLTGAVLWSFSDPSATSYLGLWSWGPPAIDKGMVFETLMGKTGGIMAFT